jgi:hypothetical protein
MNDSAVTVFDHPEFANFFRYFKGESQQLDGVELLRKALAEINPSLLSSDAEWVKKYRERPIGGGNPLTIPYQSQNDNASGAGYRECFSSSCAMLAMFWDRVPNDDAYNEVRAKYGDSTSSEAQLLALRSLGLKADFHTSGTAADLEHEILQGRPVAVGWLHHGTPQAPSGGGHWSVVIGFTPNHFFLNDPNGEADLVNGGYVSHQGGAGVAYTRQNWLPRWMPGGSGGWYLTARH